MDGNLRRERRRERLEGTEDQPRPSGLAELDGSYWSWIVGWGPWGRTWTFQSDGLDMGLFPMETFQSHGVDLPVPWSGHMVYSPTASCRLAEGVLTDHVRWRRSDDPS